MQTLDSVSFLDTSILSFLLLLRGWGNVLIRQKAQINDLKFTKTYGSYDILLQTGSDCPDCQADISQNIELQRIRVGLK